MSRLNVDLLHRTMDHVIAVAPEGTWNQGSWLGYDAELCGTVACFAGWSLMLEGGIPRLSHDISGYGVAYTDIDGLDMPDGTYVSSGEVADRARKALGLTWDEAETLFYSENTLAQLKHKIDHITEGHHG